MTVNDSYLRFFIKSLYQEEPPSTHHISGRQYVNDLAEKRRKKISETVNALGTKLNCVSRYPIQVERMDNTPLTGFAEAEYLDDLNRYINLSYLFLIEPEDIPREFRLENETDPRLDSDVFIDGFIQWMTKFLGANAIQTGILQRDVVKGFLKLSLDPEKFSKFKLFTLAHEVAHLHHEHAKKTLILSESNDKRSKLVGLSFGVVAFCAAKWLAFSMFPAVTVGVGSLLASRRIVKKYLDSRDSQACELEADATAAKLVGRDSGLVVMNAFREHSIAIRNQKTICSNSVVLKVCITDSGEERFNLFSEHPTWDKRIKHLLAIS